MSDLDPVEEAEGSNTDVSPPPGRPTPIEYDYVDDDGPAASKAGPSRGRPYVDIVFRPLEELREYTYADDSIPRPSLASRARLLDAQRTRPRSPKRIQAPRASKPMAPEVYVVDDDDDDEFRSPTVLEYEDEGEDELESEDEDEFAAVRVQPMRTRKTVSARIGEWASGRGLERRGASRLCARSLLCLSRLGRTHLYLSHSIVHIPHPHPFN